jgi:hypothetical protein
MTDKLIEIGRCGKTKSNENFKTTVSNKTYGRPKQLEKVEFFKY